MILRPSFAALAMSWLKLRPGDGGCVENWTQWLAELRS